MYIFLLNCLTCSRLLDVISTSNVRRKFNMTAPHSKKIKLASGDADREQVSHDKKEQEKDNPFEGVVLYILPDGIGPRRLELMTSNAIKNGFTVRSNMM